MNELATAKSLPPLFDNIRVPVKNNGEVFLSKYFYTELERVQLRAQESVHTKVCMCKTCQDFLSPKNNSNPRQNVHQQNVQVTITHAPSHQVPQLQLTSPSQQQFHPTPLPYIMPQTPFPYRSPYIYCMQPDLNFLEFKKRPDDCCLLFGHVFYCGRFSQYRMRKQNGESILGKPPHDGNCPVRLRR